MFNSLAALVACLLATGMTSVASHKVTVLTGALFAMLLPVICMFQARARLYPMFLILPVVMSVWCLISSELTIAPSSSMIHILSCYIALVGLGATSPVLSSFCRQMIVMSAAVLSGMVLIQTIRAGTIQTWTVTGIGSGANLVAAQLNMTLPMVVYLAMQSSGLKRLTLSVFALVCAFSVICVGSRNGIGSLMIMLVLFGLFNHKKIAAVTSIGLSVIILFLDEIMQNSVILNVLVRFRFARFQAQNTRSLIWSVCSDYIYGSPWFGIGPGKADIVLSVLDVNHAHSNLVQIALECGVIVAGLYCVLMALLLKTPAVAILKSRDSFVLTLSAVGYFLYSLTDNPIHHPQATLLLAACVHEARRVLCREEEWLQRASDPLFSPAGSLHPSLLSGIPGRQVS